MRASKSEQFRSSNLGVGKTTVAAGVAVELASRGHPVLLTTTDPAAHVTWILASENLPDLKVDRIDPLVETQRCIDRNMTTRGAELDQEGKALLLEDLRLPYPEEYVVFRTFSRVILRGMSGVVIIDTALTGHNLLLFDATGAYHRQVMRDSLQLTQNGQVMTSPMRLQATTHNRILSVSSHLRFLPICRISCRHR